MSQNKIKELQLQIKTLRKENEQLKKVAGVNTIYAINGQTPQEYAVNEPIISALRTQLDTLKQAHTHLRQVSEATTNIGRSLETLTPALELQLRGMYTEINQLKSSQSDTATTYATIVEKLENQIKAIRKDWEAESLKHANRHQEALLLLQSQNETLTQQLEEAHATLKSYQVKTQTPKIEKPSSKDPQDPFTNLSIFGD